MAFAAGEVDDVGCCKGIIVWVVVDGSEAIINLKNRKKTPGEPTPEELVFKAEDKKGCC